MSRRTNPIAWTAIEPELGLSEKWQLGFARPTKHYTAQLIYENGRPRLDRKREILTPLPRECSFIEPEDFLNGDDDLIIAAWTLRLGAGSHDRNPQPR